MKGEMMTVKPEPKDATEERRAGARLRWPIVLALALMLAAAPGSAAKSSDATVKRALDGDSLKAKVKGKGTGTYHLKGVAAPVGDDCFAGKATKRLKKLLPKGAKVTFRGGSRQVEVLRGRKHVNRAMVKGGFAHAKQGGGKLGKRLRKDEAKAEDRDKGLHAACDSGSDGNGQAQDGSGLSDGDASLSEGAKAGDVTGPEAEQRMTDELSGAAFQSFKTQDSISDEFQYHFCQDRRFRYRQHTTFSDPQFSGVTSTDKFANPWTVTEALIRDSQGYRGAVVEGTFTSKRRQDGSSDTTEPINEPFNSVVEHLNGEWYVEGRVAGHFPGQAVCDPV